MSGAQQVTLEEFVDSLTGHEEYAVEKTFGSEPSQLLQDSPVRGLRALVFVDAERRGLDRIAAKKAALDLPLGQVRTFFAEDDEVTPDDPSTDAGKDDSQPD